jgi:hypothetical protein
MPWAQIAVGLGTAVLGGAAAKSDRDAAADHSAASRRAITTATAEAKRDINRIFPQAQQARLQGFQGAQDIFANAVPQQFNQFQQGNLAAQGTAGSAAQQIQNALMGLPVDFSFLQPQQQPQPDFSFLQQPIQGTQPLAPFLQQLGQLKTDLNSPDLAQGIGNEGGQNPFPGMQTSPNVDLNMLLGNIGIDPLTGQIAINPQTGQPLDLSRILGGQF